MFDFLGESPSPFKDLPHSLAVFVFVLVLAHLLVFVLWLLVFLRQVHISQTFEVGSPHTYLHRIIALRNFVLGGKNDSFATFVESQVGADSL